MDHRYIARKRARFTAICGPVNIPYGTAVGVRDGLLSLGPDQPLCDPASQNGEDYFCAGDRAVGLRINSRFILYVFGREQLSLTSRNRSA